MDIKQELIKYAKWYDRATMPEDAQTDYADLVQNVESYLQTEGKNLVQPPVIGSALSDKHLRKMAKKVCNGHQHAMRYNNMLNACFKMGKMVIEELERQKADL